MTTFNHIRHDRRRLTTFTLFVLAILLLATFALLAGPAEARRQKACVGTYYVDLSGSKALWTFSADGTFQGTDSSEGGSSFYDSFSHQQGAWQSTGNDTTRFTSLDFTDDLLSPDDVGRADATLSFSNECHELSGNMVLLFFDLDAGGDPLNISTATNAGYPFAFSFTGQLVTAN